jgi:hypothetical protein
MPAAMQHVTTGVAPREYLDTVLAEPFEPFVFRLDSNLQSSG